MTDLSALDENQTDVFGEFEKRNYVTQKTNKKFSGKTHDKVHE